MLREGEPFHHPLLVPLLLLLVRTERSSISTIPETDPTVRFFVLVSHPLEAGKVKVYQLRRHGGLRNRIGGGRRSRHRGLHDPPVANTPPRPNAIAVPLKMPHTRDSVTITILGFVFPSDATARFHAASAVDTGAVGNAARDNLGCTLAGSVANVSFGGSVVLSLIHI